ncbi:hypothetical protein [Mycolicibacterium hodleri]|uniref:hypothetical protein n=1 Tax=Mycolicibacterium hodleri TaxID=49897 RepID=UPI001F287E2E|nr:hypothetical protein [Mycolicibacterium hodleri]
MSLSPFATAFVLTAIVLTASCGSSTSPPPEPVPTSTQPTTGHGAYASCLAENGVSTPPVGPGTPPGVDEQVWAKAQQACADEAPGPPA